MRPGEGTTEIYMRTTTMKWQQNVLMMTSFFRYPVTELTDAPYRALMPGKSLKEGVTLFVSAE